MVTTKCLQYFCFVCNVLYFITGCILVVCSSILLYRVLIYRQFLHHEITDAMWILFGTGFIVMITTWIGWKVSFRSYRLPVILFFLVILIVICIELSASIWSFVEYHRFHNVTKKHMEISLNYSQTNVNIDHTEAWEHIQTEMRCCGYYGPSDYKVNVPRSCCIVINGDDGERNSSCSGIYQRGCIQLLIDYVKKQLFYNSCLGIIVILIQVTGLFSYFHYAKALKRDLKARTIQGNENPLLNRRASHYRGT